jgi:hypothetical protein
MQLEKLAAENAGMAELVTPAYKLPASVIDALEKALQAMSFMGDTLNALGAVCEEDVEYVTPAFEAVREVLESNSPVIPDGWVACSERMPEREIDVQVYCSDKKEQMVGYMERNERDGYFRFSSLPNGVGIYCQPTHWMPLPAAPQQEVKP